MGKARYLSGLVVMIAWAAAGWAASVAYAIDSPVTRRTLTGIQGVEVVVEEFQPNVRTRVEKLGLQKEQVKNDVEIMLRKEGIRILTHDEWLRAPGRPFLYVAVNTHEYEKYWYAYDVRVQLRQKVLLEANRAVSTMASTWAMNMTGHTNIGKPSAIKEAIGLLVRRFIEAYRWANTTRPGTDDN